MFKHDLFISRDSRVLMFCFDFSITERVICRSLFANGTFPFLSKGSSNMMPSKVRFTVTRSNKPSNSSGSEDESSEQVKVYLSKFVIANAIVVKGYANHGEANLHQ